MLLKTLIFFFVITNVKGRGIESCQNTGCNVFEACCSIASWLGDDYECVSITSNPNCGRCDYHCAESFECYVGVCRCPSGTILCGNECIDSVTDINNCGNCGHQCINSTVCIDGTCQMCPMGLTGCGGTCVNLSIHITDCGSCDKQCTDQICHAGTCVSCPVNTTFCNGLCTNTTCGNGLVMINSCKIITPSLASHAMIAAVIFLVLMFLIT